MGKGDWVRGKKLLVNPEYLGPVHTSIHRARTFLNRHALPFPLQGLTLVPKESLLQVDQGLEGIKIEYWQKVDAFMSHYHQARQEAQEILGELFSDSDYPMDPRQKFRFEWRFLTLEVPGQSSILPPEVYQREKAKFIEMMEESREMAMVALRQEFADVVGQLSKRLSGAEDGKPKTIKGSMLMKVNDFLDSFNNRNLFNDEQLAALIEQARGIVNGVSGYALKYNEVLRQKVATDMETLRTDIDAAIEDIPRRRIRMAA